MPDLDLTPIALNMRLTGDGCRDLPMDMGHFQTATQTISVEHSGPDDADLRFVELAFAPDGMMLLRCTDDAGNGVRLFQETRSDWTCGLKFEY